MNVPTLMTSKQRTCLVHAARVRLQQLQSDYESMSERGDIGSRIEFLADEIACVDSAIRWLWLQQVTAG